jgi:5-oxopent-3-ene-1,2,5-tricarboxylate decarboxylase / 2-hydroxyhepta-2,4-diene-1,7-dioate isomerase
MSNELLTVYGCIMNHPVDQQQVSQQINLPPYNAAPKYPVLFIKPSNTWVDSSSNLVAPPAAKSLWVTAQLGLVFLGAQQWQVRLFHEASLAATQPQPNWFRPPVKLNAFDHSLAVSEAGLFCQFDELDRTLAEIQVITQAQSWNVTQLVLPASQWIKQVQRFIALEVGDALLLGACCPAFEVGVSGTIHSQSQGTPTVLELRNSVVAA